MDRLPKAQRSELMSRIKSRGTKPEKALGRLLKKVGVQFAAQPEHLPGKPDFLVYSGFGPSTAVFVHGCFWHRCRKHFKWPKTRAAHWRKHIGKNVARHKKNAAGLRRVGYRVAVVWEHELPRPKKGRPLEAK